jgi:hypothetical protein
MIAAAMHPDEEARLAKLRSYDILDSELDARFQLLAEQASAICGVPISLISLVDRDRQWFKAKVGVDAAEAPRELAFCAHAILQDGTFEVPDARLDPRFHDNPLVTGPMQVIFYAGVPIRGSGGLPLGTLCAIDNVPRTLEQGQREALQMLARQAEVLLEARQRARKNREAAVPVAADADEATAPILGQARLYSDRSGRMAPVVGSAAWSGSGDVIAESLTDFFQMPFDRSTGGQDSDAAKVATMIQLDTANETALTMDLEIEAAFLRSFAAKLFGASADGESEQAVLFETVNIVMGAVKRAFEAEGFEPTTGLPRERTAQAARRELSEAGASKAYVFEVEGQRVSLSLGLSPRANQTVSVAQLTEGMVLVSDLPDAGGGVLVAHGTRLTRHAIARIAASGRSDAIQVGGAALG